MGTRTLSATGLVLSVLLGHSAPSFANQIPVELWALLLMPSCEKQIDGFATSSQEPYAQWRQKHVEEVTAYERHGMNVPEKTSRGWLLSQLP